MCIRDRDFEAGTVFDIWDFRTADKLISEGRIKLTEITEDDIKAVSYTHLDVYKRQLQWEQEH